MNFVFFVNGIAFLFMAALMAADAIIFPATSSVFATSAIGCGAVGLFVMIATRGGAITFDRLHAFPMTTSLWFAAALTGALPLWLWGLTPVDAMFEAMSGITTTGSTVMVGLDDTPRGILLWRALLQFMGGIGFVVAGIALLPVMRVGGMQLFRAESSEKGEKELRSATDTAFATLSVYVALVTLAGFTYWAGGMNPFDAITHAMTTLATGGYSNYDASFGHFTSPFLQWAATVFMLAGGLPLLWYVRAYTRRTLRSEQVSAFLRSFAGVFVVLTLWLALRNDVPLLEAARLVAFNVASVVTTTGYATADYTAWGPFFAVAFFVLTPVGGCTGSTAGGGKAMRWIIMFRSLRNQVRAVAVPNGVFVTRYQGRPVSDEVLSGVMTFLFFYALTVGVVAIVLSFLGLDMATSISGSLTAVANVGPGVGSIIGPAGNFATLPDAAKLVLTFAMYAGRLELLTVFVLFMPAFWRAL